MKSRVSIQFALFLAPDITLPSALAAGAAQAGAGG